MNEVKIVFLTNKIKLSRIPDVLIKDEKKEESKFRCTCKEK